jgi:hypothetical protein
MKQQLINKIIRAKLAKVSMRGDGRTFMCDCRTL